MPRSLEPLHELLAAGRGDAVADAVGLELLEDGEHAVGARVRGLAGVDGGAQPGRARAGEEVVVAVDLAAELERVLLGAREVDAHDAAVPVALGLPHDDVVERVVELAREAEDQPRADAVREAGALHPVDGGDDDVVEVPLAAQVPLHRVEAELDRRDARGPVLLPDDGVDGALDGRRRRLDALGPAVEDLEVAVQRRDALRIGVHEVLELGVRAHGQLEPVVVRDLPEDVGRHRRAHVDVEVDELGRLEELPARIGDGELARAHRRPRAAHALTPRARRARAHPPAR